MKYLFSLLLILLTLPSQAEIISHNLVGKASDIRFTSSYQEESGLGEVQVQLCSTCTTYQLTITPETNISKNHKPLNLNQFKTHLKANGNAHMRLQFHKNRNTIFYISLSSQKEEDL